MRRGGRAETVPTAANTVICLASPPADEQRARKAGLIIFPRFMPGSELELVALRPAVAGARLMGCNLNARNLPDHGLATLAALSRDVPALSLTYGSFTQLDGVADELVRLVLEEQGDPDFWRRLGSAFRGGGTVSDAAVATNAAGLPAAGETHGVSPELALFLAYARATISGNPGPQGLEQIGARLKELIADANFRSLYFGEAVTPGNRAIHDDPGRALRFLTHILPAAYVSTPHDHGNFWVIYAQVRGHSDVTEWRCLEAAEGAQTADAFSPIKQYRLSPGDVRIFPRGAIHSIDCPADTRYVRVMGQDVGGEAAAGRW
jgi:hypothetical protein